MEPKLRITSRLSIPRAELRFRFSRSSGAGGQHVNKVSTRVELVFDVKGSTNLNDRQKELVIEREQSRIGADGCLVISSQESRSQWRNRELVVQKFVTILARALKPPVLRIASKPTKTSQERRLKGKRLASARKDTRRKPDME